MNIGMTNAIKMREDRNTGIILNPFYKAFTAAWNNHINRPLKTCQHHANGFSIRGGNELDACLG